MIPTTGPRLNWQRIVYHIAFGGFSLIFIFGCQILYPTVKNYQDSEVPPDQIVTVDGAWNIAGIWEVKANQENALIWKFKEGPIYGNAVGQFKLKPGNYEVLIENNDVGLEDSIHPYRARFYVNLQAGHNYRVDFNLTNIWSTSKAWRHYWIEDLTTGQVIAGSKQ